MENNESIALIKKYGVDINFKNLLQHGNRGTKKVRLICVSFFVILYRENKTPKGGRNYLIMVTIIIMMILL